MKKLIEEYKDVILEAISASIFFVILFIVVKGIYKINDINLGFLI